MLGMTVLAIALSRIARNTMPEQRPGVRKSESAMNYLHSSLHRGSYANDPVNAAMLFCIMLASALGEESRSSKLGSFMSQ